MIERVTPGLTRSISGPMKTKVLVLRLALVSLVLGACSLMTGCGPTVTPNTPPPTPVPLDTPLPALPRPA